MLAAFDECSGNAEVPEVDWSDTANTLPDQQRCLEDHSLADR